MRLGTIKTKNGEQRAAVQKGTDWLVLEAGDVGELINQADWRETVAKAVDGGGSTTITEADVEFVQPVTNPAKVICCGLNYHDHIVETGREIPEFPTLFAKFADTLTAPNADIEVENSEKVDWESELALVIGTPVYRASKEEAEAAILGYTVANDVSMRDWQSRTLQWFQGKAWDNSTPMGPFIVTADEISPKEGLEIRGEIDGETVQISNTRELVFDSADLVAYVSQFTKLVPGDIILTGTPGGVGLGMSPQRWLKDGEVLSTTIEGIGTLANKLKITI